MTELQQSHHVETAPVAPPGHRPTLTRLSQLWQSWGAYAMAALFTLIAFALMNAKHSAFNTRVYDFARFTQAIWATCHGQFLFTTITYGSILGNHFSPLMAAASPLVSLINSERVLFFTQALSVAVTGLVLYDLMRRKRPRLAPWFLLAFYLNPALHDVTLFEVRRITFGMPFLALGLHGLATKRRALMLAGLGIALLAKESVAPYVVMIGLYLLIFEKERWWGLGLALFGSLWLIVVSLWIIPHLSAAKGHQFIYPQLYYFSHLGDGYHGIVATLIEAPSALLRQMFGATQLGAIGRILLPLGLVLPFLEPRWVVICVPFVALMFLSSDIDMMELGKWYPTTILPVLFGAIAVGWERLPRRWERIAMAWLLVTTLVGYALFSQAPLGGRYDPATYAVTPRDRLIGSLLKRVPREAAVAAQVPYVPHLTLRHDIYHYPWIRIGEEAIDIFVLDRHADAYPFDRMGINEAIDRHVADAALVVLEEVDGFYILGRHAPQQPAFPVGQTAEGAIHLERIEVAVADDQGVYHTTTSAPLLLHPGQTVRVTLYWEALGSPGVERTVSVRIADAGGALLAQHDGLPGGGSKPTSWWETGWAFRDVTYLTLPSDAPSGPAGLDLVLYDTFTLEVIPFEGTPEGDAGVLHLLPATIE